MQVFDFLRTIRKQPRHVRARVFMALVIIIVPLALYIWGISFYQGLRMIALDAGQTHEEQPTLGQQALVRVSDIFNRSRQGFAYVTTSITSSIRAIHVSEWIATLVRKVQGKPEIQPVTPNASDAILPFSSPVVSVTPDASLIQ